MIVEVQKIDEVVPRAQHVPPQVDLDPPAGVFDVSEHNLALGTPGLDPACDRDLGSILAHLVAVGGQRFRCGMGALVAIGEGLDAQRLQRSPLIPAGRLDV
jgi:hypothetical protein